MKNVMRKLGSVKVWIALWSMGIITFIVIKDMVGFNGLATIMVGPIVAYLAANVWQDKIHINKPPINTAPAVDEKKGTGDE